MRGRSGSTGKPAFEQFFIKRYIIKGTLQNF